MKKYLLLITILLSGVLYGSQLSQAYQKEYTFLKAQKSELQSRLIKEDNNHKEAITAAGEKLNGLQEELIKVSENLKVSQ
ncbi:MAG: hypothetical protein U9N49_05275, partial [Campylobacterota bacterium]|nr:hypothetical protein [Campylobacterota bacterium]